MVKWRNSSCLLNHDMPNIGNLMWKTFDAYKFQLQIWHPQWQSLLHSQPLIILRWTFGEKTRLKLYPPPENKQWNSTSWESPFAWNKDNVEYKIYIMIQNGDMLQCHVSWIDQKVWREMIQLSLENDVARNHHWRAKWLKFRSRLGCCQDIMASGSTTTRSIPV